MSAPAQDPLGQTAASLLSGILGDLQRLVEQQFQLTRREIEDELRQRASAAAVMALGLALLFLDAIESSLALVHLLHWAASPPAADPAWLPLWACHAAMAVVLFVVGGVLTLAGRVKFRSTVACQNPTGVILEEHVPWKTPPK